MRFGRTADSGHPGYAPGASSVLSGLFGLVTGKGTGKKTSTRTPMEPRRAPSHHLNRWRDEGRTNLVLAGIRLGVLATDRPPIGRIGRGQFRTWKALAVAVENARRALDS